MDDNKFAVSPRTLRLDLSCFSSNDLIQLLGRYPGVMLCQYLRDFGEVFFRPDFEWGSRGTPCIVYRRVLK